MKKILVTGSSGKLGAAVVALFRAKGYEVRGLDLLPGPATNYLADIRVERDAQQAVQGCGAIIHTAALHGKHSDLNYPREAFIQTNILGTNHLLQAAVTHGVQKCIYISTTSIYGYAMARSGTAVWVDEGLPPQPRDIYDITKLSCEWLCKDYAEKAGLEATVLRVSRFLPEDDNTRANHRLYRGLDERDGARACLLAVETSLPFFEVFNISNQSPFRREDLQALYQDPREVICRYFPEAEEVYRQRGWTFPACIDRVYDISKATRLLGFRPEYNFDTFL